MSALLAIRYVTIGKLFFTTANIKGVLPLLFLIFMSALLSNRYVTIGKLQFITADIKGVSPK